MSIIQILSLVVRAPIPQDPTLASTYYFAEALPGGRSYPVGTGKEQRKARYKLLEVAHRRKEEVRIVPKGLSEKAEHLLMQVVILGDAYQREDVPRRILVKSTAVGEDEYEAVAKELVEAGLAESVDSDYGSLRATLAGKERVRGPRKPASEAVGRTRGMYARVSTVEASPAKLDEATHFFGQQVLPQLQQMDGFKGFIVLGDRQRGKLFGVALWESEEVMHSTEEVVSRRRGGIPHPPGGATVDEENYEVFILEVSS